MRHRRGRFGRIAIAGLAALVISGCGTAAPSAPGGSAAAPSTGARPTDQLGSAGIRAQVAAALSARNLILADPKVPYRPGEPAEFTNIARTVYQVQLRDDPDNGFIVVYALSTADEAARAGAVLAAFLGTGPGRVQAPQGTVHVIRQVGSNLIYYRWLPGAIADPETPKVQQALETLGVGVAVPR